MRQTKDQGYIRNLVYSIQDQRKKHLRSHLLRIVVLGSAAMATISAQTPQTTRVEETDPSVTYTGTWTPQTDPLASGGSYTTSSTAGSTVTFNFTGDTLTIYRLIDPTGGQADVTIDGTPRGQLRFDAQARVYLVPSEFDNLGTGPHTIVLSVNTTPNNIYAQTTVFIDAFETPTFFVPTSAQSTALASYNQLRTQLGLPTARLSVPLSLAAQAHAEYLTQNNTTGAGELFGQAGITGFTGPFSPDRAEYFGYPIGASTFENTGATADPNASINYWMSTVYQRLNMVTYSTTEIGFGGSGFVNLTASDLLLGYRAVSTPTARIISTYPANNQTNVPINYTEDPGGDPTGGAPRPLGFPISLHMAIPAGLGTDNVATTGTLTDANGNVVNTKLVWLQNDGLQLIRDRNSYFLIPLQPLTPNMQYTAHIVGIDALQHKFDQSWVFTTGAGTTTTPPTPTWQVQPGALAQISVAADGTVLGANASNNIYQWPPINWVQVPGAAVNVAVVNANKAFAYNPNGAVMPTATGTAGLWAWNGTAWSQLQMPAGVTSFTWMAAAKDGTLYAVDPSGNVNRLDAQAGTWSIASLGANFPAGHVAGQSGSLFYFVQTADGGVDGTGTGPGAIWKVYAGVANVLPGNSTNTPFADVSVDSAGDLWAVDSMQGVYHWNGTGWDTITGMMISQLAVGNAGNLWGINAQGAIYQWH